MAGSRRKRRRRGYRRLQTLHGSPPSHNNTTPSPLAATQLLPPLPPHAVEVLPAIHAFTTARFHARFHQPYPLPIPPSFLRLRGLRLTESPIQGETHLFLPSSLLATLLEFLRLAPYRTAYFLPLFYSSPFSPSSLFSFSSYFSFRVPVFISLSLPLAVSFSP